MGDPTGAAIDAIVNDGHLIVNNASTAITLSHITGAGTFTQAGPAAVTVLANNYRGGTDIRGGVLFAADERALGTGNVANDAVLASAGRRGVISVGGNYRQSSSATVRFTVAGKGSSPSLDVAGRAELDGTLELIADGQAFRARGRRLVLVRAAGGLRGRFHSIVADGLEVVAHYGPTRCTVTVVKREPAVLVNRVRRFPAPRSEI